METIYRHLHDKLLEWFSEGQLKDHLFYGVSQSLHDLLCYLYKDEKVTYQILLAAMEETESEYGDMRSMARSKGATVWEEGIAELKELIEALTTVVKSSSVPGKFGSPMKNKYKFQKKDGTSAPNSPKKTRGPGTSATVPYKLGQKPIQCYNCGGWGHG